MLVTLWSDVPQPAYSGGPRSLQGVSWGGKRKKGSMDTSDASRLSNRMFLFED